MTVKSLFQPTATEQAFYEGIITEAVQIHGHDVVYVPREVVRRDDLFGEDTASRFDNGQTVEMYLENLEGYEGEELFSKFGVDIQDGGTLIVTRSRFNAAVGTPASLTRPREGDLVFVPLTNALFEITFVEHEEPFYQLNNLPVYKLRINLFKYNQEDLDIDEMDTVPVESQVGQVLVLDSTGAFVIGETITQTQAVGVVTGEVQAIDGVNLTVSHVSSDSISFNVFESGTPIISGTSALTKNVVSVSNKVGRYEANDVIETEADGVIDFTEGSPFGEF